MRKFKFRLQTLLDRRRAQEEEILIELSAIQNELSSEIDKLEKLKDLSTEAFNQLAQGLKQSVDAVETMRRDDYASATLDDIVVQKLTIKSVRKRLEAKLNEVVEAMKERKVLESVRDKQETQHWLIQRRAEQQSLDEIASVRYARGM
jgi:flagellar FliJ protein